MNNHQAWEGPSSFHGGQQEQSNFLSNLQKFLTTIALLTLGYYVLNFLDAWPSTIKRRIYEIIIYLIPSQAIYALQSIMSRFTRMSDENLRFRRSEFGNQAAKAEAIRRMLGYAPLPQVLRKARSMPGVDSILPASKEIGPPGLGNWDNSCYQNSVLQGLASLPEFRKYIEESLRLCDGVAAPAATHRALHSFLAQLADTTSRRQTLWTPDILKSMDSWQQQDAQEYFSKVLDAVDKEASKYGSCLQKRASPGFEILPDISLKEEETTSLLEKVSLNESSPSPVPRHRRAYSDYNRQTSTKIWPKQTRGSPYKSPLDGMLAQALECQTCGFSEGISLTQFNCLTLNLGLRGHSYLEELLDDYTKPEVVEGVECTECTKTASDKAQKQEAGDQKDDQPSPKKRPKLKSVLRTKEKQITLGRLSKDLVIHVNRSIFDDYGDQLKNTSLIRYPVRLGIRNRWCAPLDEDSNGDRIEAVYELKCAVTHYGRHENGHYVAFGKRGKGWYCFNDEIVQKLPEEEVLSRGNVFMLFYEATDENAATEEVAEHENVQASGQEMARSSTTGSSESEGEPVDESPQTPARAIPFMRTAGGTLGPEQSPPAPSPVVSAL